jgi:hypothetical protein
MSTKKSKLPYFMVGTFILNLFFFLVWLSSWLWTGAKFSGPWDGPAVASVVLTAATLVLTAVAVIAGLLAFWGFTTLREHAAKIAQEAVEEAMQVVPVKEQAAAERAVKAMIASEIQRLMGSAASDQIAEVYGREGNDD